MDAILTFWNQLGLEQDWQLFSDWYGSQGWAATKWFFLGLVLSYLIRKIIQPSTLRRFTSWRPSRDVEQRKRTNTVVNVLRGTGNLVLWLLIVALMLNAFGVSVGTIMTSAGILGLAVSLGAQNVVRDILAGFFILLENHYNIGDIIDVGDVTGEVEEINLRTTILRNLNGSVHIVPNGTIAVVTNRTKNWAQVVLDTVIAPNEDIDRAIAVIKKVGADLMQEKVFQQAVLSAPKVLGVTEVSKTQIVIRTLIKTGPSRQWTVERIMRKKIKQAFDLAQIKVYE